jgi:translocation and assembly module TamB
MPKYLPKHRKRRRDWGRVLAQVLCLLFGIVGAVPFGIGLLVRTPLVRGWAARETAAVLERELGLLARYRVDVEAWPLSVGLSNVAVEASDGLGPALEVARVSVRPRLFSLLAGRLDAGHIEIDAPRARLVVRDGQLRNVVYRLPKTSEGGKVRHAPFTSIAVTDANLNLDIDGIRADGHDIDVDISAEEGLAFDVVLRSGEQTISRTRKHAPADADGSRAEGGDSTDEVAVEEDAVCQLDARFRLTEDAVLVRRLALHGFVDDDGAPGTKPACSLPSTDPRRVELGLSHLHTWLRDAQRFELEGGAHLRLPLGVVNRFLPAPVLHGYVSADLDGHFGKTGVLPVVRGKVEAKGIELDRYHLASEFSADVAIDDDVIRSERVSVGMGDGTIVLNKLSVEPLKKGAPIRIGSLDSTNVKFSALMRDLGVTPHAHVTWLYRTTHVGVTEGTLAPLRLDGDFTGTSGDFEVFDRAVDDPLRRHMIGVRDAKVAGHVSVRPDAVIFRGSRIDFGSSHIEATVSLGFSNDIVLSVAQSHVDLADISPLASLKLAGKTTVTAEMKGKFNDPVLTGELSAQGFMLADFPLGDITSSKVRFRPLTVDFSEIHAKKGKSAFDVPTARLDFNGPATLVADAHVDAQDLDLRDFLHMWHFDNDPRFDDLAGHGHTKADIHYDLGGAADQCGNGYLSVRGGTHLVSFDLFQEHYDSLDSDFTYVWADRDAADLGLDVDVRSLTLKKGRGSLFGSATIRRGGVVRGELVASDVPISRIQALGPGAKLLEGSTSAVAHVAGTIDALEADIQAKVSPIRVGAATLPASHVHVTLEPRRRTREPIGRTKCGQPITGPFDRAEYDHDLVQGTFHATGQMFGEQVAFDDLTVTRQRKKVTAGLVRMNRLDLGALAQLPSAGKGEDRPKEEYGGTLTASLDIASLMLDAPETMRAKMQVNALSLHTKSAKITLENSAPPITIGEDRLSLPSLWFAFTAGGLLGHMSIGGEMKHLSSSPEVDLAATVAPIDLSNLASIVPRIERASGTLDASLYVRGKLSKPAYVGEAHLKKGELALRGFALPIADLNVDLSIDGGEVRIAKGSALVGGGSVSLAGHAPVNRLSLGEGAVVVTARGVSLPVSDGIDMTCNADLRIELNDPSSEEEEAPLPKVTGEVTLTSFSYTRPIGISADLGSLAQRTRRRTFESYDPADDFAAFDVKLHTREPLRLRNNLVEAQLVIDSDALVFSGTNQRFGMRGRLRILPGGRLRLRANEFEVRQGWVRFDDPTRIAPSVDVTAVTEYRRYSSAGSGTGSAATAGAATGGGTRAGGTWRITLHAYGDADNLRLDMTSEPALSSEDIVLLLTIGMTRAELDQLQASSLGGTAALEALSSLTGADSAVKRALPVIDDFRFGSAYSSRTGRTEATVTLGKRVTNEVRANVTSGLSENREIRSNVEWKLTPRVSAQGSYDNVNDVSSSSLGNLGADVRWRLEFE